jgi:hypothetical protein
MLPDSEVGAGTVRLAVTRILKPAFFQLAMEEEDDARMTSEQLKELSEALSVCSAKSSVLKERDELRALMKENMSSEEVRFRDVPSCRQISFSRFTGSLGGAF